jgi:hypothetical protein
MKDWRIAMLQYAEGKPTPGPNSKYQSVAFDAPVAADASR